MKGLSLALATLLPLAAYAQDHANRPDPAATARTLLAHMDAGEYAQAEAMFGADMAAAVPVEKLQAVWESLPAQAGEATGRGEPAIESTAGAQLATIPLHYSKAELVAKVAVDDNGRVVGFLIQPAPPPPAPAVAADANFHETDFSVGEGERALPGTLALPDGTGEAADRRVPAVVLVHGSGPQDRDESIGANKPFLDLARGLAARGIAVLRYEKRTHARPQDFADGEFTIDDETTNDAVLAVDALRKAPGVDPDRVFVLGHSQGGMLAPRIAAVSSHVAGLVLLAAPSRPLLDIVVEQNRRLAVLDDGKTSDAERAAIQALVEQVRITRDPNTDPSTKTVLGQPVGYWRSVDRVEPVVEAARVALPMLVLQGARDIQVVDADWQHWRGAFHDDPKVAFRLYETLNHLGIAGEGEGSLAEYRKPGHVDAQLIDDTAAWIKAH
jgi:alpha-beta hydrolase superfamily lysophospholipase